MNFLTTQNLFGLSPQELKDVYKAGRGKPTDPAGPGVFVPFSAGGTAKPPDAFVPSTAGPAAGGKAKTIGPVGASAITVPTVVGTGKTASGFVPVYKDSTTSTTTGSTTTRASGGPVDHKSPIGLAPAGFFSSAAAPNTSTTFFPAPMAKHGAQSGSAYTPVANPYNGAGWFCMDQPSGGNGGQFNGYNMGTFPPSQTYLDCNSSTLTLLQYPRPENPEKTRVDYIELMQEAIQASTPVSHFDFSRPPPKDPFETLFQSVNCLKFLLEHDEKAVRPRMDTIYDRVLMETGKKDQAHAAVCEAVNETYLPVFVHFEYLSRTDPLSLPSTHLASQLENVLRIEGTPRMNYDEIMRSDHFTTWKTVKECLHMFISA